MQIIIYVDCILFNNDAKKMNDQNLWFSHEKNEILPKIYCLVFNKIGCAQLYMMVNSHAYYCSCWLYIIQEFLVKIEFSIKTEILPKIKHSISMKIGYAQLHYDG